MPITQLNHLEISFRSRTNAGDGMKLRLETENQIGSKYPERGGDLQGEEHKVLGEDDQISVR